MEKLNLEEIKIRSITGGSLHKRSLVFHIEYQNSYLQYTVNHICAQTINLVALVKLIHICLKFFSVPSLDIKSSFGIIIP